MSILSDYKALLMSPMQGKTAIPDDFVWFNEMAHVVDYKTKWSELLLHVKPRQTLISQAISEIYK